MAASVLVILVLLIGNCRADVVARVESLLERGQADSARAALEASAGLSNGVEYYRGRLAVSGGTAKRHLRGVTSRGGSYEAAAIFQLAEAAYADPGGIYLTARRTYQTFVSRFPNHPHVPLALYRIGRTFQVTGSPSDVDSARVVYRQILDRYPASTIAQYAAIALVESDLQGGDRIAAERHTAGLPKAPVWRGAESLYEGVGLLAGEPVVEGRFWVQVGAFGKQTSVDALVKRLTGTVPRVRLIDGGGLTRVQVGPYESRAAAQRSSDHISNTESLTCRVIED